MPYSPVKTALIGYGFSAKTFHLPFIESLPELALCAISSSQQAAVLADFPQAEWYGDAYQMLDQSDAELVIITAPNDVHFPLAKYALERGKHVIVEKPFVTRKEDGEALIQLAEQQGLVLSVFHNRRWDGDFLTVKKLTATVLKFASAGVSWLKREAVFCMTWRRICLIKHSRCLACRKRSMRNVESCARKGKPSITTI